MEDQHSMTDDKPVVVDPRPAPQDKEIARMAAARERWAERVPPVQIAFAEDGSRSIVAPHTDNSGNLMRLGDTFGSRSGDFLAIQLTELSASLRTRGRKEATAQEINAGLAFIAAVAPENELEAALAVQMASNHALTTDLLGRAAGSDNLDQMQAFGNLAVKMQRTFTAQIEALARLRGKGQQTVRVEHVTVHPGGQAVVGDVHVHGKGGGFTPERQGQPRGTGQPQTGPTLLGQDTTGNGVPVSGHAERPLPDTRRAKSRRAAG